MYAPEPHRTDILDLRLHAQGANLRNRVIPADPTFDPPTFCPLWAACEQAPGHDGGCSRSMGLARRHVSPTHRPGSMLGLCGACDRSTS